jgi:endoglucanase
MTKGRLVAIAAAILVIAIGGPLLAIVTNDAEPESPRPTLDEASNASERFLEDYLDPDGRVVRRDQGNDTVSEGQAYAMLIAVAIGARDDFDSAWNWSKDELRQPSGMFAWRWADGEVQDTQPATDADLDMARALYVAADRFDEPGYREEADELAGAIVEETFVEPGSGGPVVVAGPWASNEAPYFINPSYYAPRVFDDMVQLTGDDKWQGAIERQRAIVSDLIGTESDPMLPPDWATVSEDGSVQASESPGGDQPPRYSYDAVRTPIRLAESCHPEDQELAAQMWTILNESRSSRGAVTMNLEGEIQDPTQGAVGFVASAAAAKAAGDTMQMESLLDLADRTDTNQQTYYGSAWHALGRIKLTTDWLGAC